MQILSLSVRAQYLQAGKPESQSPGPKVMDNRINFLFTSQSQKTF